MLPEGRLCCLTLPPLEGSFYTDKEFLKHPRAYNDLFAMCCLCVKGDWVHAKTGITHMKLQGRTYHMLFDAERAPSKAAQTSHKCILMTEPERKRIADGQSLNDNVIKQIEQELNEINPFIHLFKRLGQEESVDAKLVFRHVERRTGTNNFLDHDPNAEVAVIMATEEVPYEKRQIVVKKHGQASHYMDITSPFMECLQYPVLFPRGNLGYSWDMKSPDGKKITQHQYMKFLLLSDARFSALGRLSETWLLDCYCRLEEDHLKYLEYAQKQHNQNTQRIAPASELRAVLANRSTSSVISNLDGDETVQGEGGREAGRIYLPSNFVGGDRYFRMKYLDAMAIVARKGSPSYFLTFTSNGSWPEHAQSRLNQNTEPHVLARVFKLKLDELLRDLRSGRLFGKPEYIIWTVEWQARGLPHGAHRAACRRPLLSEAE